MERFVVIQTVTECQLAQKLCAALEESEIPVMLEHVELNEEGLRATGYRVLVPFSLSQRANVVTNRILERNKGFNPDSFTVRNNQSQRGWAALN
jgi:hypothetical protein